MQIRKLSFDGLQHPSGMDMVPVISWQLVSDRKGTMQEAYRIVITQGEKTVWDSGLIKSEQNVGIRPECGLVPYTEYRCEVTACSNHGEQAKASGTFETGKMDDPWRAQWICGQGEFDDDEKTPPYHFLKEYSLTNKKRIVKTRMYVTALGCFRLKLNGRAVSEDYFSPGYTQYTDRVLYCTYDVTDLVKDAVRIAVDAEVSGGWYAGLFCGYRYYDTAQVPVRWGFGYGLSYTNFVYTDLRTNENRVFVTVENAGERAGDEIVQLYLACRRV